MLVEGEHAEILEEEVGDAGILLPAGLVGGDNLVVPMESKEGKGMLVGMVLPGNRHPKDQRAQTKNLDSYLVAMLEWMTPGAKSPPAFNFLIKSDVLTGRGEKEIKEQGGEKGTRSAS